MPAIAYTEMIERAKQAADMGDGFPNTQTWLYFLNAELRKLWVNVVRSGYPIAVYNESITANGSSQYNIDEPFAVIGALGIKSSGTGYYNIPVKHSWERVDFASGDTPRECYIITNHITTGKIGVQFYPSPTTGTFFLICVSRPPKVVSTTPTPSTDESNSVYLPFGWEERVVLGMAQRALAKEETTNPAIEREISAVNEQIDFHIHDYLARQANTAYSDRDGLTLLPYTSWIHV